MTDPHHATLEEQLTSSRARTALWTAATSLGIVLVVVLVTLLYDQYIVEPRQRDISDAQEEIGTSIEDLCDVAEGLQVFVIAFVPDSEATTPEQETALADLREVNC